MKPVFEAAPELILGRPWDFYHLPLDQQAVLVGKSFTTTGSDTLYIPVELSPAQFNYGRRYGALSLHRSRDWPQRFRHLNAIYVRAFSPDDLDLCVYWERLTTDQADHVYAAVLESIITIPKTGRTYLELLQTIQSDVGGGTIGE